MPTLDLRLLSLFSWLTFHVLSSLLPFVYPQNGYEANPLLLAGHFMSSNRWTGQMGDFSIQLHRLTE